jgi:hypothetical protein
MVRGAIPVVVAGRIGFTALNLFDVTVPIPREGLSPPVNLGLSPPVN